MVNQFATNFNKNFLRFIQLRDSSIFSDARMIKKIKKTFSLPTNEIDYIIKSFDAKSTLTRY